MIENLIMFLRVNKTKKFEKDAEKSSEMIKKRTVHEI